MHRADAHLDFRLGLFDVLGVGVTRQILMRPSMRADRHAGLDHLLGDFRMPACVLADFEESCPEAFVSQRLEHRRRVAPPGTVVESQNHFLVAQEVILLEMLKAEARTASRVDLDDACDPHAAGFVACRNGIGRRRRLRLRRSIRRSRMLLPSVACATRIGAAAVAGTLSAPPRASWLTRLTGCRRAAAGPAEAAELEAVAWEGAAVIFCAETTPKVARPRIIKAATILITKRTISS